MMKDAKKIETFEDILKALKERPDWLEELRRIILTEELIALPQKFESFLQKEFRPVKKDVESLKEDVGVLKQDVKVLKDDVAELKGDSFERRVRERAPSYFGKLVRRCRVLSFEELADILDEALEKGTISEVEREEVLKSDVVVRGILKTEKEKMIILVGEVSTKVDKSDVERAFERARIMSRVTGISSLSVVIGREYTEGAKKRAEEIGVLLV